MTCKSIDLLTRQLKGALHQERACLSEFLKLLAELDERKAYAPLGYSSTFKYCVEALHLSPHQAYLRICVARAGRRHPEIFEHIASGQLNMSGVQKMSPALSISETPEAVISAALGRSKREIQELVAEVCPVPDPPNDVEPDLLSPGRVYLSIVISTEAEQLIERAQALGAPDDLGELVEEALRHYVEGLVTKRCRSISGPGRKISSSVQRQVLERDGFRCAFVSDDGVRCSETRGLEFDHVRPVALGGGEGVTADDIRLLCKTHNLHVAGTMLGESFMEEKIQAARSTRSSASSAPEQLGPAPLMEAADPDAAGAMTARDPTPGGP